MKLSEIIATIVNYINSNKPSDLNFTVINSWNNENELDENGTIAVAITNKEILHHGNSNDYSANLVISGQTLTSEDVNQQYIMRLSDFAEQLITVEWLTENIQNCAGALKNNVDFNNDGEANTFSIGFTLYICED